jgi:hypothetical protein
VGKGATGWDAEVLLRRAQPTGTVGDGDVSHPGRNAVGATVGAGRGSAYRHCVQVVWPGNLDGQRAGLDGHRGDGAERGEEKIVVGTTETQSTQREFGRGESGESPLLIRTIVLLYESVFFNS